MEEKNGRKRDPGESVSGNYWATTHSSKTWITYLRKFYGDVNWLNSSDKILSCRSSSTAVQRTGGTLRYFFLSSKNIFDAYHLFEKVAAWFNNCFPETTDRIPRGQECQCLASLPHTWKRVEIWIRVTPGASWSAGKRKVVTHLN